MDMEGAQDFIEGMSPADKRYYLDGNYPIDPECYYAYIDGYVEAIDLREYVIDSCKEIFDDLIYKDTYDVPDRLEAVIDLFFEDEDEGTASKSVKRGSRGKTTARSQGAKRTNTAKKPAISKASASRKAPAKKPAKRTTKATSGRR